MKTIISKQLEKRISDKWGQGHFGAPRGRREHTGQDYLCPPGTLVVSPVSGTVIKHGYPYADDLSFRYVRVETEDRDIHDVFYVSPSVPVGEKVKECDVIGTSQKLGDRYPDIDEHIHHQIKINGNYVDPVEWWDAK